MYAFIAHALSCSAKLLTADLDYTAPDPSAPCHAAPVLQAVTSLRSFCAARTAALGSAIAEHVEALVGGEVGRLLSRCGLAEIADRIRLYQSQVSVVATAAVLGHKT